MAIATAFALSYSSHDLDKPILVALDTTGTSSAHHTPGYTVKGVDGRAWTYVRFSSSDVAGIAGGPACWAQSTENMVVTPDISDSSGATSGEGFAGVFMAVPTDQYYGWIQTKGKVMVKLSSTCAVGSAVCVMADSVFTTVSGQTGIAIGTSLEAGVATNFPYVQLLDH